MYIVGSSVHMLAYQWVVLSMRDLYGWPNIDTQESHHMTAFEKLPTLLPTLHQQKLGGPHDISRPLPLTIHPVTMGKDSDPVLTAARKAGLFARLGRAPPDAAELAGLQELKRAAQADVRTIESKRQMRRVICAQCGRGPATGAKLSMCARCRCAPQRRRVVGLG
jgi:hypothetical protein